MKFDRLVKIADFKNEGFKQALKRDFPNLDFNKPTSRKDIGSLIRIMDGRRTEKEKKKNLKYLKR